MKKLIPGFLLVLLVLSSGVLSGCSSATQNTAASTAQHSGSSAAQHTDSSTVRHSGSSTARHADASAAQPDPKGQDARFEDDFEADTVLIPDPLYPWNRFWFSFNNYAMNYVARPIHTAYDFVTPDPVQTSVTNFFHNLLFPVRFVNSLLQFKFMQAGVEMSRFVLNTTYGLGGLFDPASDKKPIVETDDEDLGQTLGVWGAGEGFYLVLPLLGPSTPRDTVGLVGDYFLTPTTYLRPYALQYGLDGIRVVNDLGDILHQLDELNKIAVDPYAAMRDAYIQHRRARIAR